MRIFAGKTVLLIVRCHSNQLFRKSHDQRHGMFGNAQCILTRCNCNANSPCLGCFCVNTVIPYPVIGNDLQVGILGHPLITDRMKAVNHSSDIFGCVIRIPLFIFKLDMKALLLQNFDCTFCNRLCNQNCWHKMRLLFFFTRCSRA